MHRFYRAFVATVTISTSMVFAATVAAPPAHAWTLKTLRSFCMRQNCVDGDQPAALLVGPRRLLGITYEGGNRSYGTAFTLQMAPDRTWKHKIVFDFCNCGEGEPIPPLVEDVHGNFYGITASGFAQIYKLSRRGAIQVLHTFDAGLPVSLTYQGASSGALYDGVSPLYGVSNNYSPDGGGVVFQLRKKPHRSNVWDFSILYTFCATRPCKGGSAPLSVVADPSGNLFGTTEGGGLTDNGVVFELRPADGALKETVLANFCSDPPTCTDGEFPTGQLTMDAAGDLYGMTQGGGASGYAGLVYKVVPRGRRSKLVVLHSFCAWTDCADGTSPDSGVVVDGNGNIFGTTDSGGAHQRAGVAFEITGHKFRKLYDFCALDGCADGSSPETVALDGQGNVFGVTQSGGTGQNGGTVFELSP